MTELEKFLKEQISIIVPEYEILEFRANVGDSSYSMEFYAVIHGEKMQCYDMADNGLFKEKDMDIVFKTIADYIRHMPNYKKENLNKIFITIPSDIA